MANLLAIIPVISSKAVTSIVGGGAVSGEHVNAWLHQHCHQGLCLWC